MRRIAICAVLLSALFSVGLTRARADDDMLVVTQDESSMERVIEANLKTKHDLKITEKFDKADDLWLELPFTADPMPKYRYAVDTQSLNKKDDGEIVERGVRVQLFTSVKIAADRQPEVLRIINDFNRRKVFSAMYIDTDGEIVLDWTLNVMAQGMHVEYVYDVIAREDKLWRELYPQLPADLR